MGSSVFVSFPSITAQVSLRDMILIIFARKYIFSILWGCCNMQPLLLITVSHSAE